MPMMNKTRLAVMTLIGVMRRSVRRIVVVANPSVECARWVCCSELTGSDRGDKFRRAINRWRQCQTRSRPGPERDGGRGVRPK